MNDLHLPEPVLTRVVPAIDVLASGLSPARPLPAAAPALRLDQALALLRQSGQSDPPGDPSSPGYMQHLVAQPGERVTR